MVVWSTDRPRSVTSSSTSRYEREYRKYHRTTHTIITGSKCRHLNRAGRGLHTAPAYQNPISDLQHIRLAAVCDSAGRPRPARRPGVASYNAETLKTFRQRVAAGACSTGRAPRSSEKKACCFCRNGQRRRKTVGPGKVEIQRQDSHFPTAQNACGARKKKAVYTKCLAHADRRTTLPTKMTYSSVCMSTLGESAASNFARISISSAKMLSNADRKSTRL